MKNLRSSRVAAIIALGLVLVLTIGVTTAIAKGRGGGKGVVTEVSGPLATVTIRIVDYYGGAGLPDTKVKLYNDVTGFSETGSTGADGCVTFANVPYWDTDYRASISKRGYRASIRIVPVEQAEVFAALIAYPVSIW